MNHALMRRPARTIWRNEQDVLLVSLLTEHRSLLRTASQHSGRARKQFWDLIAHELTVRYHIVRNARQCKDRFRLLHTRGIRNMHNGVGPQTGVDALCLELNRMFYLDPRNNIALTESRPETEQDDNYSAHDEDEPNDNETHETNASNDEAAINEPPMSARPSYPGDCSIDTERLVTQELIRDDPNKLHAQHTGERTLPMLPPASAAPGSLVPFAPDYSDPQIQLLMEQVLTLDRQVADLYARMDDLARNMEHRFAERPVESDLDNESRSSRVTRNSSTTSTAGVAEPASSTAAAAAPATITPAAIIPDMPSLRPSSTIQEPPSLAASRPAASLQMATPGAPIQQHPQLQPLPSAFRPAFPPPVAHMTNPRNSRPPPSRSQPSAGSRPHSRSRNSR